jgi:hypothetical protein
MNLFLGNCDFEHHLGPAGPRVLPAQIQRRNSEMAFCLVPLAQPGDCVWTRELPEPTFGQHLESVGLADVRFVRDAADIPGGAVLVPWGWCKPVQDWAAKKAWVRDAPDLDVVARANSRECSSALEAEWGVGIPGTQTIRTLRDLDRALSAAASLRRGAVIKANFGMSARERILVRRSALRPQDVQWARRRLNRTEPLFFEPWVEAIVEFGCQFSIPRSEPPLLEGITGLLTDAQGTYRGSLLPSGVEASPADLIPASVLEIVERAARRIQQSGYFGPLGIDAMQYRTSSGEVRWRPLQDINARLTMGRVALGMRRLLKPGEQAAWLHLRADDALGAEGEISSAPLLPGVRLVRTSPRRVGERPASQRTVLIVAQSRPILDAALSTTWPVHERHLA